MGYQLGNCMGICSKLIVIYKSPILYPTCGFIQAFKASYTDYVHYSHVSVSHHL